MPSEPVHIILPKDSIRIGFFAVPPEHLDELQRLRAQWSAAFNEHRDDHTLIANEQYQYANAVARHHAELRGEWGIWTTFTSLVGYISRRLMRARDRDVFSAEEARRMARAIDTHEQRVGLDKVLANVARRAFGGPPADLPQAYAALKDTLAVAVAQGVGFAWAMHDDDAEQKIAEERRKKEELMRELAALPRLTEEEMRAQDAAIDRYIEEQDMRYEADLVAKARGIATVWLCQLTDEDIEAVRALEHEGHARLRRGHTRKARHSFDAARELAHERALTTRTLGTLKECITLEMLARRLEDEHPKAVESLGLYTAAEVRALRDTLRAWEAAQGGEAALGRALSATTDRQQKLALRAYRALLRALGGAARRRAGLAWLFDTDSMLEDSGFRMR